MNSFKQLSKSCKRYLRNYSNSKRIFYCLGVFFLVSLFSFVELSTNKLDSALLFNFLSKAKPETETSQFSLQAEFSKIKYLDSRTKKELIQSINLASQQTGLPEKLIFLLIKHESSFRKNVVSSAGASGYTQLMPATAKHFCNIDYSHIFETKLNVLCGAKYLKRLMNDFGGDMQLALAAYNAGPSRIRKLINHPNCSFKDIKHKIPRETKSYVAVIRSSFFKTV